MTAESKCSCQHCSGHILVNDEHIGRTILCPHCQRETRLLFPTTPSAPVPAAGVQPKPWATTKPPLHPAADWQEQNLLKSRPVEDRLELIGKTFLIFGIIGGVICGFTFIANFDNYDNSGKLLGIFIAGLAFIGQGFVLWMLFRALAEIIRLLRKISTK